MEIRVAQLEDAAAIRTIYNREVTSTTVTFDLVPRSLDEQRHWLSQRSGAHLVLVAIVDDAVVGFASLSPYKERAAYKTTVEDSVYVDRDGRGRGVGRALLEALVETARDHGFHAMMARIVGGHAASIALHEAVGFRHVGTEIEVGRKFGQWLDVESMQLLL